MHNFKIRLEFRGTCSKQDKVTPSLINGVNLFIIYELSTCSRDLSTDFTLKGCLFGALKLTKIVDPDKYYFGYGIGFDSSLLFLLPNFDWVKNAIIFGVGNSASLMHIDNKEKYILVVGKSLTQGLVDIVITGEAKYTTKFARPRKNFSSSLYYNEGNNFLFVNATKIYQFQAKLCETISSVFRKYFKRFYSQ